MTNHQRKGRDWGTGLAAVLGWLLLAPALAAGADDSTRAAADVLNRLLGEKARGIRLEQIPADDGRDVYEFEANDGTLCVRGSSAVAICRGANDYLRATRLGMSTRYGANLNLPASWPNAAKTRTAAPYAIRQYYNVVSAGYVYPYWDWAQWEKELDYIAVHGFNTLMAPAATEAIAERVWRKLGLAQAEIDAFYTGPAHLPWQRMGNLTQHDGPLPPSWHADQIAIQHKLLDRMRELGIEPIVPGFAGFVPPGIKRIHPQLKLHTALWGGFAKEKQSLMIPPSEPLFAEIEKLYVAEWQKEFGKCKYILVDSFNEMELPNTGRPATELLADYGEQTYKAIRDANADAIWVLQGWMLGYQRGIWNKDTVKALLSRIPDDKILILDYAHDYNCVFWCNGANYAVFDGFFGKPWAQGFVPNMGGKVAYTGLLSFYATHPAETLKSPKKGRLAGFCLDPEGFENNEAVYELLADASWRTEAVDLDPWLEAYCQNRYGGYPAEMKKAWNLFRLTCYGSFTDHPHFGWQHGVCGYGTVNRDPRFLLGVQAFLSCADSLKQSPLYRADAIEQAALALGLKADEWFILAKSGYASGHIEFGDKALARATQLLNDLDRLLESHPVHRLERWLDFTHKHGGGDAEKARYESNARRLVTVWGPPVNDYSCRLWSGLTRDFYAPRMKRVLDSVKSGKQFDRAAWEEQWVRGSGVSHIEPFADPVAEAVRLVDAACAESLPQLPKAKTASVCARVPARMSAGTTELIAIPISIPRVTK